jgi:hypothetical protein
MFVTMRAAAPRSGWLLPPVAAAAGLAGAGRAAVLAGAAAGLAGAAVVFAGAAVVLAGADGAAAGVAGAEAVRAPCVAPAGVAGADLPSALAGAVAPLPEGGVSPLDPGL